MLAPPQPFTIWSGFQMDKDWTPPTLHDLKRLPKWTRIGPPRPFTMWSGSCKRTRVAPPQPFTIWKRTMIGPLNPSRLGEANGQGLDPPNPSRFGAAPKWTRIGPPNPSSGHPTGQGWDPPNPSRFGAVPKWTRIGPPTLHDLAGVPFQEADS